MLELFDDLQMNEEDIEQFMNAYEDFMKDANNYNDWIRAQKYTNDFYKQKAAELNMNIEYYIQEFL